LNPNFLVDSPAC